MGIRPIIYCGSGDDGSRQIAHPSDEAATNGVRLIAKSVRYKGGTQVPSFRSIVVLPHEAKEFIWVASLSVDMGEMTPICAGALYRGVGDDEDHGEEVRVKSVWIDEDGTTQVQVFHEDEYVANPANKSVTGEEFMDKIGDTLIRTNSDHEAWEWRN